MGTMGKTIELFRWIYEGEKNNWMKKTNYVKKRIELFTGGIY